MVSYSFISWYQNLNKKYVQLDKAQFFFAIRIFKFKLRNVKQIRQKSTLSAQTRKKIKHFMVTSTHARTQAHQAPRTQACQAYNHAKHASTPSKEARKHARTPSTQARKHAKKPRT